MMFKSLIFASCIVSGVLASNKKITWNPVGKGDGNCSPAAVKAIAADVYDTSRFAKAAVKDLEDPNSQLYSIMIDGRDAGSRGYGDNTAAIFTSRYKKIDGVFNDASKNLQWLYISCVDTMNLCSTGAQGYYDPNRKSIIVCENEYMKMKSINQLDCNGDTNNILAQPARAAFWINMFTRWNSVRNAAAAYNPNDVRCCAAGPAAAQWFAKNEPAVAAMNGETYGWYAQQAYMFHTKCKGKVFKQADMALQPGGIDPKCKSFMKNKSYQAYALGY